MLDIFPSPLPPYFLRQGFSLNLKITDSLRLAGHQAPGVCLSISHQCRDHRCMLQPWLHMWVLGIQTQVPVLAQQNELSSLPGFGLWELTRQGIGKSENMVKVKRLGIGCRELYACSPSYLGDRGRKIV